MKKFVWSIVFFLTLSMQRQVVAQRNINFDRDWRFQLGDASNAASVELDDKNWELLDLPHDWDISKKISPTAPMGGGGGFYPSGMGWYRKTWDVPANKLKQKWSLCFEGAYMYATVYVNGTKAGASLYGYNPFSIDLSPYLKAGKNTVAVKVDNSQQKNSRWYSGSGIYRHVWLNCTEPVHLVPDELFIYTTKAGEQAATLKATAAVKNEQNKTVKGVVTFKLLDKEGKTAAVKELPISVDADAQATVNTEMELKKPLLWSPEQPDRYSVVVTFAANAIVQDQLSLKFGVRHLVWSTKGLFINGKSYKLNGGNIHHDNGILGAAAFDKAEERKIAIMLASGFNSIRTSHNPPSPALLNACDSMGMLVMDEIFDCWTKSKRNNDFSTNFSEQWQNQLDAFCKRDRNHPSVIFWSTGNEVPGALDPMIGGSYCQKIADRFRSLDPSRPVTQGIVAWPKTPAEDSVYVRQLKALDIVGSNYTMDNLVRDRKTKYPDIIIVGTESFPGDGYAAGIYKHIMRNDFVVGNHVWTAQDYLGEVGCGRWFYKHDTTEPFDKARSVKEGKTVWLGHGNDKLFPWHGAICGDIDILGNRKPSSHFKNILWEKGEKIFMAVRQPQYLDGDTIDNKGFTIYPVYQNWNYKGKEGFPYEVEVYAKAEKTQLFLNDKLIDEKPCLEKQSFKAVFTVPYAPGVLKAVAFDKGATIGTAVIKTVGEPYAIRLIPEKTVLKNDGQDLVFVNVEVVDKEGNLRPDANNTIHFTIEGSGIIQALGNANLKSEDVYVGNDCKVHQGKAMVVIKGNRRMASSVINLVASSEGLKPAKVSLQAK